jgi:hypothetical protein
MATRFRIRIAQAPTPDLVHRLRNLGEDLSRSLGGKGRVNMAEVDAATESFVVEVASSRDLGDVATLLKQQLARAGSDDAFAIERS